MCKLYNNIEPNTMIFLCSLLIYDILLTDIIGMFLLHAAFMKRDTFRKHVGEGGNNGSFSCCLPPPINIKKVLISGK